MEHLPTMDDVKVDEKYTFIPQTNDAEALGPKLKALINSVVAVARIGDGEIWIYDPEGGSEIDEPIYHYELYPLAQDWDS